MEKRLENIIKRYIQNLQLRGVNITSDNCCLTVEPLSTAFNWATSKEGYVYWCNANQYLLNKCTCEKKFPQIVKEYLKEHSVSELIIYI